MLHQQQQKSASLLSDNGAVAPDSIKPATGCQTLADPAWLTAVQASEDTSSNFTHASSSYSSSDADRPISAAKSACADLPDLISFSNDESESSPSTLANAVFDAVDPLVVESPTATSVPDLISFSDAVPDKESGTTVATDQFAMPEPAVTGLFELLALQVELPENVDNSPDAQAMPIPLLSLLDLSGSQTTATNSLCAVQHVPAAPSGTLPELSGQQMGLNTLAMHGRGVPIADNWPPTSAPGSPSQVTADCAPDEAALAAMQQSADEKLPPMPMTASDANHNSFVWRPTAAPVPLTQAYASRSGDVMSEPIGLDTAPLADCTKGFTTLTGVLLPDDDHILIWDPGRC